MKPRSILMSKGNFNLPNILSVLRLLSIVLLIWFFKNGMNMAAFITYLAASATDAIDGYIARKYDLITPLGKLLDPLADKLMLITVLVCMYISGILPLWIPIVIVIKEFVQIIGGFFLLHKKDTVVQSNIFGKLTTVFFSISVVLLFWHDYLAPYDKYALVFTVIFAVFALIQYIVLYVKAVEKGNHTALNDSVDK